MIACFFQLYIYIYSDEFESQSDTEQCLETGIRTGRPSFKCIPMTHTW